LKTADAIAVVLVDLEVEWAVVLNWRVDTA